MSIFSVFMGGGGSEKERFIGRTGAEDNVISAMMQENAADGTTFEEIKESLDKRGNQLDDDALKAILEKLVREECIRWDEKLEGYVFVGGEKK